MYVLPSPVGDYFKGGIRPLKVKVETELPRSTPAFGSVKTGANYAAALGLPVSAAIPLAYQAVTILGLAAFARTGAFAPFRFSQVLLMTALPFLLQWSLGGQPVRTSAATGLLVGATAWLHGLSWRVLEAWRDAPAISAAEILRLASQQALWTGLLTAAVLFGWRFVVRGLALRGRQLAPLVQNKWRMLND